MVSLTYTVTALLCLTCILYRVGCDGVVGSEKKTDKCGVCGGDNTSCHIVSGIFTRTGLTYGYNKVTKIPKGACNINITEVIPSPNYLALKITNGDYILNGEYAIDIGGNYEAAGTSFKYDRPPPNHPRNKKESIVAQGPLTQDVDIMLLKQQHRNRGVQYQYTIPAEKTPKNTSSTTDLNVKQQDDSRRYRGIPRQPQKPTSNDKTKPVGAGTRANVGVQGPQDRTRAGYPSPGYRRPTYNQPRRYVPYNSWQGQGHQYPRYLGTQGGGGARYVPPYPNVQEQHRQWPPGVYRRRPNYPPHNDRISPLPGPRPYPPNRRFLQQPNRAVYEWRRSGFTQCTATCGGGIQNTIIMCVRVDNAAVVTDDNCRQAKPPVQSVACNQRPCPPGWHTTEWTRCSTTCDTGTQIREVTCKQRVSNKIIISLAEEKCLGEPKPAIRQGCNRDNPCNKWQIGKWGRCSVQCGRGQRTRELICVNLNNQTVPENKCRPPKPPVAEICDMGSCAKTWFASGWSKECSAECGEGVVTRKVVCTANRCNPYNRPSASQPCKNDIPCGGQWFIGPWGKCSVSCGKGLKKREILCVRKHSAGIMAIVGAENCKHLEKPESEQPCSQPDCQAEWYSTEWTQCSRTCNTGFQTREIKCLDPHQKFSVLCAPSDKPTIKQTCNTLPCPRRNPVYGRQTHWRKGSSHTESTGHQCRDHFKHCRYIVQARLCNYPYYKTRCCLSCNSNKYH